MRRILAVIVVVGLSVTIAKADEKPAPPPSEPSTVAPEKDVRLAKLAGTQPQKVGILTYYPNKGGGYTFLEGKDIAFYALPYMPSTYTIKYALVVWENVNGQQTPRVIPDSITLWTISTAKMPFGGLTVYRREKKKTYPGVSHALREDTQVAKWSRDTSDGAFRLSIIAGDHETQLKLKSIIPVLEHAPKPLPSKP